MEISDIRRSSTAPCGGDGCGSNWRRLGEGCINVEFSADQRALEDFGLPPKVDSKDATRFVEKMDCYEDATLACG